MLKNDLLNQYFRTIPNKELYGYIRRIQEGEKDFNGLCSEISLSTSLGVGLIKQSIVENLLREVARRWANTVDMDERPDVTITCPHCDEIITFSAKYVDRIIENFKTTGGVWWVCPVCGKKDYLEDTLKREGIKWDL